MIIEEVEAPHGQKMVEVTVRFWTNDIAPTEGKIIPKHIHDSGVVKITVNDAHGITEEKWTPFKFRTLMHDIQELFERHKIVMHY